MANDLKRFFAKTLPPLLLGGIGLAGEATLVHQYANLVEPDAVSRLALFFVACVVGAVAWGVWAGVGEIAASEGPSDEEQAGSLSYDRRHAPRRMAA